MTSLPIFAITAFLLSFRPIAAAYIVQVGHMEEQCFVIRTPPGKISTIEGSYDMLDENLPAEPLRVIWLDHEFTRLYKNGYGEHSGFFQIHAQGRLTFCLQNAMDSVSKDELDREVFFDIRIIVDEPLNPLIGQAITVQDKLWGLQNHHLVMRAREEIHRGVVEQTFSDLLKWTLLEAAALVAVSLMQVMYFRRFLEKRRFM